MREGLKVVPIIVSTNDGEWLASCLSSLLAGSYPPYRILVIDNVCNDGTAAAAASAGPLVTTIRTGKRLGFADCNNIGFEEARRLGADYIYMLNPDTVLHQTGLEMLVDFLDTNPLYGIAGSLQYDYYSSGWTELNRWSQDTLNEAAALGSRPREIGRFNIVDHYYVQGSGLLFRAKILESIGYLDPVYRTFYEETDFCRRCKFHGLGVAIVMDSRIKHVGGGNWRKSRRNHWERDRLFLRNQFIYFLSAPQPHQNSLVAAARLVARHAAMLREGLEDLRLPLTRYPGVVISAILKIGAIRRLRKRNEAILAARQGGSAGQPLAQE